jgi:hypothetical protein
VANGARVAGAVVCAAAVVGAGTVPGAAAGDPQAVSSRLITSMINIGKVFFFLYILPSFAEYNRKIVSDANEKNLRIQ